MTETIWIVLPLPNRALSPNARVNPFAKRAAARKQREKTAEAIWDCAVDSTPWECCKVSVRMFYKTKRKRDQDNAVSMLKSMYDGIVDARVVLDDTPEHMERDWPDLDNVDKEWPRMEVTIEKRG